MRRLARLAAAAGAATFLVAVASAESVPMMVNCIEVGSDAPVDRIKPSTCTLTTHGSPTPPNSERLRLAGLRWMRWGQMFAVATGVSIPNHYPFTRQQVVVVLRASQDPGECPGHYSGAVITWRNFERTATLSCWGA